MAKKKKLIIAMICAVLVVAVVVAIVLVAKNKNNNNPTETTTVAEVQEPIKITEAVKELDSSKYVVQAIDGVAYIVVLDENGKHVTNDKNQILVVVLGEDGKVVYDENGNPKTMWIDVKGPLVNRVGITTDDFTLAIPEGWKPHGGGYFVKADSQTNMIRCDVINQEGYADMSLSEFLTAYGENLSKKHETYKKNGFTVQLEKKNITLSNGISAVYQKEVIHNKNGGLTNYTEIVYLEVDGTKYRISLTVPDDEAQKKLGDFDFVSYVNQSISF